MRLARAARRKRPVFPRLRWAALAWLAVWVPSYAVYLGWKNFLLLCDVGVFLTCLGIWRGRAWLLSSQAVGSLVISGAWVLDVVSRMASGRHLIGGTEYMWNAERPLFVRLLSLFHVAVVPVLLWSLRRTGYDRRGLPVTIAVTAVVLVASRAVGDAADNMNYTFQDPFFHHAWGPAPLHLAVTLVALSAGAFLPAHLLLARLLPAAERARTAA
jgi:hypothetical protein